MSTYSELQRLGHTCMYTTCIHTYKERFFLLEGHLYQERLVFNHFKNKVPVKLGECIFSNENPRASGALRQALDPGH